VANSDSHVTRIARGLSAVTSIFRCHGLQHTPSDADRLGSHDLIYWILFVGLLATWFLFLFAPQHERLGMLEGRLHVLHSHLGVEKRELKRLERSINDLTRGDPHAWERAARLQLGWVEPGEIVDLASWNPSRFVKPAIDAMKSAPQMPPIPPAVLPRPTIPPIPPPAPAMRRIQIKIADASGTELLGPTQGSPPPSPSPRAPANFRARPAPPIPNVAAR
jgi:hypothetical protein